jgi:hypothetical protein
MTSATTTSKSPYLSVVVPVYNGEERIGDTIRDLLAYLSDAELDAELIVVDDGSTDQTPARSHDALEGAPIPVQFVHSPANEGKGAAVRRGMQLARGTLRVFIDADLAYPPSEIGHIVRRLEAGADVAIASRVHPDSRYVISPSFFRYLYTRHVSGRVFNWLVQLFLLPGIRDTQAGLKGFSQNAVEMLFNGWLPGGFSFDLAVLFRARLLGMKVEQVPVVYRYDTEPTTVRFLLDTLIVLRDMLQIRARLGRVWSGSVSSERQGDVRRTFARSASTWRPPGAAALRSSGLRAILLGILGVALVSVVVARLSIPSGTVAVLAWLIAMGAFAFLALRSDAVRGTFAALPTLRRTELLVLIALVGVGAWLRLARLDDLPAMVHGDTAECGILGLDILHGHVADLFDFSPWYMTPYISFLPHAASFWLTGLSVVGLRLPSALFGIGCIVSMYILVRTWFGAPRALLATALFTVSHAVIHFSRIGLWNIQVLFYALTVFALLAIGLRRGSAFCAAAAGIFSGLGLYSYTAGRLVPIVVISFLVLQLVRLRARRFSAYYVAGMLLTALPLFLNYVKHPEVLDMDRTASVWVLAEVNRSHVESTLGATTTAGILLEQVRRTFAGFAFLGDTSSQYGTEQPLLSLLTAALGILGLFVCLRRVRQRPYAFLLIWLGFGLVLGSFVIIDPPAYTRLIIIFPIPFILAAIAVHALLRPLSRRFSLGAAELAVVSVLVFAQSAAFDLGGYYRFTQKMEIVPREWDVLRVLNRLEGKSDLYLFTGPFLFADSPVLRLFSTGTHAVTAFSEDDLPTLLARDTVFVVTPEYRRIGYLINEQFPGIERDAVEERGVLKAWVYRCTYDNGCRHSIG